MFEMKQSKSRIILNGLIVEHTNREAESQRESVVRDQNGMVELKRKDRKKTKGGARRLVNGMFGNGSVVKNLISKRFKRRRLKQKMVEVKDGFVVKDENTKTNSIEIQQNKIQETPKIRQIEEKVTMPTVHYIKRKVLKQHGIECVNGKFELENKTGKKSKREMVKDTWSMGRKRDAGNQNDHGGQQKPLEINRRNVEEQFNAGNQNDHGGKQKPQELNCWNIAEQCRVANENNPGKQEMTQEINR